MSLVKTKHFHCIFSCFLFLVIAVVVFQSSMIALGDFSAYNNVEVILIYLHNNSQKAFNCSNYKLTDRKFDNCNLLQQFTCRDDCSDRQDLKVLLAEDPQI